MKYGLPRDEKPKKRWKNAIEHELRCLQMEVCHLKDQLNEANKRLIELSSPKQSDPLTFILDVSRNENPFAQISQNEQNNFSSTNKSQCPFATDLNGNSNQRFTTGGSQSSQGNPFASVGSRRTHFQSTWDYDGMTKKAVRFHSITCMPIYNDNKSFEELRHEDYVLKGIGFSNQIQRHKDTKLRSSRTERNFSFTTKNWKLERKKSEGSVNRTSQFLTPWYLPQKLLKAPWPFGDSPNRNGTSNPSDTIASGTSDVSSESNFEAELNRSEPTSTFQNNKETNNCSDVRITTKNENFASQVLLELRKMGENISSINDQLSKMDSNLSDVSSRVSVMDSRLSAVDMFVTMQRFDKKWQGLETRLATLETPSPAKPLNLRVDEATNKDTTHHLSKDTTLGENISQNEKIHDMSFDGENNKNCQASEFEESSSPRPINNIKNEVETLSAMDTSDLNLSDFVRSISCTDTTLGNKSLCTSSLLNDTHLSDSSSKIKLENSSIEMADLKSDSLPLDSALVENSSLQENKSIIYSESEPSISEKIDNINKERVSNSEETNKKANSVVMCDEVTGMHEEPKLNQEPEIQVTYLENDNNNRKITSDPLGVIEQKDVPSNKQDDSFSKQIENDAGNEFVMVEKSDVEESVEPNSKYKTMSSPEASSASELKMYSDITEYLEINMGKKKNLVYEFGFEAKPGSSLEEIRGHENKSDKSQETPSGDDSFQQFKTHLIENTSVGAKQSSPFVFHSKTPEMPPDYDQD